MGSGWFAGADAGATQWPTLKPSLTPNDVGGVFFDIVG
jgi:hypothetical protein